MLPSIYYTCYVTATLISLETLNPDIKCMTLATVHAKECSRMFVYSSEWN